MTVAGNVIRVVDWIDYDEADDKPESIGGLGGWFGFDQPNTWDDYIAIWNDEAKPYAEAIKDDVLASGRFIGGDEHQNADDGVPLFSDGTIGSFSFRGWGDLMAAIATLKTGKPHNYMDFYMRATMAESEG